MCNEELDLVKLLSSCPKGTKLYSPLLGEVALISSDLCDVGKYPIIVRGTDGEQYLFTKDGKYFCDSSLNGECLLFPSKDQRDWSEFNQYKDGDILSTTDSRAFILKHFNEEGYPIAYCGIDLTDSFFHVGSTVGQWTHEPYRLATKEETKFLMREMERAGYIWNAETKVLRKDLPVGTIVAAGDSSVLSQYCLRRYAGNNKCFLNSEGPEHNCGKTAEWDAIIPVEHLELNSMGEIITDERYIYGKLY